MVTVPSYQPTERTRPAFQQSVNVRASAEDFGAGVGRGMQQLGQGVDQLSTAMAQVRDIEDMTAAKEADNALAEWSRAAMYGDGGYMTLEGKAAVDARSKFEADWEEQRKQFGAKLTSPGAARRYAEASGARFQSVKESVIVHQAQQRKTWVKEASASRVKMFADDALAAADDPIKVQKSIRGGLMELQEQAGLEGWDADTLKARSEEFISGVHENVALRLAQDDPLAAEKYIEQHRADLSGEAQYQLEEKLSTDLKKEKAKQAAADILAKLGGGETDVLAELEKIDDPDVRDMARATISATISMQNAADKAAKDSATEQAYKLIETQNVSPYDLPAEITQVIGMDGMKALMEYWDRRARGENRTDDGLLYELQTQYATDPEAFAKRDLLALRPQLSTSDWEKVTGWRQTALTDQRKATEDGLSLTAAFSQANDALAAVGITTTGLQGGQREEAASRVAQFNNVLAARMEEWKRDNGGKNPDQAEIQAMINQLLLPVVIKKQALFPWDQQREARLFEAGSRADGETVDVQVQYTDIPQHMREAIRQDLSQPEPDGLGRAPSEAEITAQYEAFILNQ